MKKFNLDKVEKVFKSCFKRKVSITLGALVIFLMTGCGGGGGGSSDNAPNYEVSGPTGEEIIRPEVPTIPPIIENPNTEENETSKPGEVIEIRDNIEIRKNDDNTYILKSLTSDIEATGVLTEDGKGITITSQTPVADGRFDLNGVTIEEEITKAIGKVYKFTKDGKVTRLMVKGDGNYQVERDGKVYTLKVTKDGKLEGNVLVEEKKDEAIIKYLIDSDNRLTDGDILVTKLGKEYKIEKIGDKYSLNVDGIVVSTDKNGNIWSLNDEKVKGKLLEDKKSITILSDAKIAGFNLKDTTISKIIDKKDCTLYSFKTNDKKEFLLQVNKNGTNIVVEDKKMVYEYKVNSGKLEGNITVKKLFGSSVITYEIDKDGVIQDKDVKIEYVDKDGKIKDYIAKRIEDNKYQIGDIIYKKDSNSDQWIKMEEGLENPGDNDVIKVPGTTLEAKKTGENIYTLTDTTDNKVNVVGTVLGEKFTIKSDSKGLNGINLKGYTIGKEKENSYTFEKDGKTTIVSKNDNGSYKVTEKIPGISEYVATYEMSADGEIQDGNIQIYDSKVWKGSIAKEGDIYIVDNKKFKKENGKWIEIKDLQGGTVVQEVEGLTGYKIIKENGNTHVIVGNSGVNITGINSILSKDSFTSEEIVKNIYKNNKQIEPQMQTGDYNKEGIGQLYNAIDKDKTENLINTKKLTIAEDEKKRRAIGQLAYDGGAMSYNFGELNVTSNKGIAVGQYILNMDQSAMAAYNFGLINVNSSGTENLGSYSGINGAGIYIESAQKTTMAFNYGKIVINNTNNKNMHCSVGILANGANTKAFNFGTIEVNFGEKDLIDVSKNQGEVKNSIFMVAQNGASIYNYGIFKSDAAITLDSPISTSTKAKYVSDDKVVFSNNVAVMSEVGKGNEYIVEDFIIAKNGVEGLDNLKSLGVYSVSTVENTDSEGDKVVDLKMTKTKKLEDLVSGDLSRKVKEAGLDSYVYEDGTGAAAEAINFLAENGELDKVSKAFSEEYDNLNGAILETSRRMMNDSIELMNATESEFSGDFDRNFKGILVSKNVPNLKLGVFKNYREDANYGAGMDYNRDSITAILTQKITDKFSINYGYENTKNEYVNGSKLESHNFMLGANYVTPINFLGMNYDFTGDVVVGRNKMDKNGVKGDNFYTYSVGMLNSLNKNLELKYFNKSEVVVGLRTVVFGHESIDDKSVGSKIDKNTNFSNSFVAGLNLSKEFGITNNAKLKLTSNFGYEKELMNTSDWKDSMTVFTGNKVDMSIPMKDDKGGRAKALVKAEVEFKNGFATGVYGSVDSLGYKEVGMSISYKF